MNIWTEEEDELLKYLYGEIPLSNILLIIPTHTKSSISQRAYKLNLKCDRSKLYRKYSVNKKFFSEKTPSALYWAGFIAADGCINPKKRALRVTLSIKDISHLEKLKKEIEYSGKLLFFKIKRKNPNHKDTELVDLSINGVPECIENLLRFYNITPRKSLTLKPPDGLSLQESLLFIIGYIDGDGSIRFRNRDKRKDGTYRQDFALEAAGTKEMLNWIMKTFQEICQEIANIKLKSNGNIYELRYSGNRAKIIYRALMSIDCPQRMERKWCYEV